MESGPELDDGKRKRWHLLVSGVVQGVGFRPYVYKLARRYELVGFVNNSPIGVVLEIEGPHSALEGFLAALPAEAPPLVRIGEVQRSRIPLLHDTAFTIHESAPGEAAFTLVPPDICVCDDCLAEGRDSRNRRYEYPFTNCTNCGPRYSIILDIPYDRRQTTMADFPMCDACRAEYADPANRRFHAQPNACPVCGPEMQLAFKVSSAVQNNAGNTGARSILETVADVLHGGGIVAWKGLGGYQLACDARQPAAVEELRRRKRRSEKPFAVMVANASSVEQMCELSEAERAVLTSRERPIVLLKRRADAGLAEAVSPGNPNTGVMLPCTPMHDLLFRILREKWNAKPMLVMTSGNVSDEPIVIDNEAAKAQLASIADAFVHHNRRILTRVDDSIVRVVEGAPMLLRRARGYAPSPVFLGLGDAEVLACGAQQKSTFCLTKAGFALPSQHLGDLESYETLEFFEQTLERMKRLFHVNPTVVAHDLHPGYSSTQLAMRLDSETKIGVQHHHAHIAACMAEHRLEGSVIGIAWDGTGLGTDGTIWGGEFLAASLAGFERYAYLRTVQLPGGDAAVREPWRVARSYLHDAFDTRIPKGVTCSQPVSPEKIRLVDAMIERRVATTETSSCGRLFDAVASLIGLSQVVSFEGQAAMALEAIAADDAENVYDFAIEEASPVQVDMRPMIRQIIRDLDRATPVSRIAARFHNTLVAVVARVCADMRSRLQLSRVCLSGGCFQNARLLRGCVAALRAEQFDVFYPMRLPANDGGISVGQAVVACERIRRGV